MPRSRRLAPLPVPAARTLVGVLAVVCLLAVDFTSYSSPFTLQVFVLQARAIVGGPGQTVPTPGGDGC